MNHEQVYANKISKIYYVYQDWQPGFAEMSKTLASKIKFVQGFRGTQFFEENSLNNRTAQSDGVLIVLDDVIEELLKQKDSLSIFTRLATQYMFLLIFSLLFRMVHHRNLSIILQTQILLVNSDVFRSILKQASNLIIFNSLRGRQSQKSLSIQLFDKANFLPAVSADILRSRGAFTPLLIDLRNTTREEIRVRSGIPGIDQEFTVYQI